MCSSCTSIGLHHIGGWCIAFNPSLPFHNELVIGCLQYFPPLQDLLSGYKPQDELTDCSSAIPGSKQDPLCLRLMVQGTKQRYIPALKIL